MNFKDIPKFCISLPNSARRPIVEEEFKKNGLAVTMFDAIDKKDLIVPELSEKRLLKHDEGIMDGILACMSSHLKLIQHAKDNKLPAICVFEDDVVFCDDFKKRIKYIDNLKIDYDFFSLGGHFNKPALFFTPDYTDACPTDSQYIYKVQHQGGTYAYIITEAVYDFVLRNCTYNYGMDQFFSDHLYHRFKCYAFVPFLASCRNCTSEITGSDWVYENISWYYKQGDVQFPKLDLSDCTFITAIKIDSPDRAFNFLRVIQYLCDTFKTTIIIKESDASCKTLELLEKIDKQDCTIIHSFESNTTGAFHRTRLLNEALCKVTTPVTINYDVDVFMEPSAYILARDKVLKGYALVYPYKQGDGTQKMVTVPEQVKLNYQGESLFNPEWNKPWQSYCGFVQFFKTELYIKGGMENELFISYGPEDRERYERFQRLGYSVCFMENSIYHIEHSRGADSSTSNPHFQANDMLMNKFREMSETELIDYYKNVEYLKKYV